tara:strand:- start:190 stop:450 length:261 start_codon:yes stop_codon:yes gene_type:complete
MNSHQTDWEKNIIDNADSYSIVEWRPLDKSTKTIVKTYDEAKELFQKTIKEHTSTLAYAIKDQSHANLNHLDDFKSEVKYVKSKTR